MTAAARGYVGIDGCRRGAWFGVALGRDGAWEARLLPTADIGHIVRSAHAALIDIPIGLVESGPQERACDREARRLLGRKRAASVFPAPARASLRARGYTEAVSINRRVTGRGISRQSWAIAPAIRAVDDLLQRDERARAVLREGHPELCFWALNGGTPLAYDKKSAAGRAERMAIVRRFFPPAAVLLEQAASGYRRREVAFDDIIDAMVLAVTAKIGDGRYRTLPAHPPRDAAGLPMEMVYCVP